MKHKKTDKKIEERVQLEDVPRVQISRRTDLLKGYINGKVVQELNFEIDLDMLHAMQLSTGHNDAQWKKNNDQIVELKESIKQVQLVLRVLRNLLSKYEKLEIEEEQANKKLLADRLILPKTKKS